MKLSPFLKALAVLLLFFAPGMFAHGQRTIIHRGVLFLFSGFEARKDVHRWERPSGRYYNRVKAFGQPKFGMREYVPQQSRRTKDRGTITNNHAIRLHSSGVRSSLIRRRLPVELLRGCRILLRLDVFNEGISTPSISYNGVKIAYEIKTATGMQYPQLAMPRQPFRRDGAGFVIVVPPDATELTLVLGLEEVSGAVQFDNVELSVLSGPQPSATAERSQPLRKRLRGMMISTFATAADLRALAGWGANHVRWQLTWDGFPESPADTAGIFAYRSWLDRALHHVKGLMPLADSLGLHVVLDLHTLPGGRIYPDQHHRVFDERTLQENFREIWKEIALLFRTEPALWGYDLANEPIEGALPDDTGQPPLTDWPELAAATAADIRTIDEVHPVIVEGAPGGGPLAFVGLPALAKDSNVVYSVHMYEPAEFTHQRVYGPGPEVSYPGTIHGVYWDSAAVRRALQPVRDWQLRAGSPAMYVGEFSAVRWAPDSSAYRYLRDCITIFERWGWSWAYHAFREWEGWSVEHAGQKGDDRRSPTQTDREMLLREAFGKND